ncbi:MAG: replication-associated recombination protein A [Peptoniphilus harei]|uniref:replication-associated recombination protein A n=1 Tax=Peptoniphilus lacydonensis TaxID=1673725 RepID=UPI0028FE2FA0|nr:replication-associated recombination protein A [Peptoniphilus lacydonensis]MBS6610226.1 replication-associated recombination protein A [Peptoniphilus harei]MDU2115237.1 replication-associated recombination protein A [Peptoniphilus lacydonensis]
MDLFEFSMQKNLKNNAPLADRMRPRNLNEFVGQDHVIGDGKYLSRLIKSDRIGSILFYGPPGVGKTTLAEIIAKTTNKNFVKLSAVTSNLKELREVLKKAEDSMKFHDVSTIVFIDEIHRFNKTQQDALLPFVESGIITLIGATTENPYFEVNRALLSRMQVINLLPLDDKDLFKLLDTALSDSERGFGNKNIEMNNFAKKVLVKNSNGDGRFLLNSLEIAVLSTDEIDGVINIDEKVIEDSLLVKNIKYDKNDSEHYDTISAFIKSMRGSDPDAALIYLAKMLEGGEDIKFIARRLIIFASEDVGNADPQAMILASSCFNSIDVVGMPEARIILAQTVTYLATTEKSNASYLGINKAIEDVKKSNNVVIPKNIRDKHNPQNETNKKYLYPHNYENAYINQNYMPENFSGEKYYEPKNIGYEIEIKRHLDSLK